MVVTLALCCALAACQRTEEVPIAGVSDAQALLGKTYLSSAAQGRLVEGSPCDFMGASVEWENEPEKIGWSDAVAVCQGVPVLLIAKTRKSNAPLLSFPLWEIVAVQVLPQVSNYAEEGLGDDPLELISPTAGQCDVGQSGSQPVYVLLRWGGRDTVAGPPGVEAVWMIDAANDRFVALDPRDVRCEQMTE
ncbi:hypothetical protein [Acidovorax sp. LjRoot194]